MSSNKREIKIGMILNYLSMAIEGIILFLLNPFIIRKLGQDSYGVYSLMTSFAGYLSIFEFGLGGTIIRYVAKYEAEKDENGKENFLSMCFIIYFIIAIIMISAIVVLYNNMNTIFSKSLMSTQIVIAKKMFIIIAISMTITTLGSVFSAIISAYEKFIFSRLLILVTTCLNVFLTIIVLITKTTPIRLTFITLIVSIVTIVANIIYAFFKLKIKVKLHKWDKKLFGEVFKFSIFIFLQTIISQIYWRLDQLIIGIEIENAASQLAIYAVAMKINDLVLAFTTVINRYQLPTITRLSEVEKNDDKLLQYIGKTSKFVAILYIAIIIGFIFFGKKFIYFYAGAEYEIAYYIVLIVVISSSLNRIHGCGSDVLKAKNKHGWYTGTVFITAILNIILTIYLIRLNGIVGAAIGTAISVILGSTIAYYLCLHIKARVNIKKMLKLTFDGFLPVVIISSILAFLLNYYIYDSSIAKYLMKMIIFAIMYLILIFKFVLEDEEKNKIINKLKRFKRC